MLHHLKTLGVLAQFIWSVRHERDHQGTYCLQYKHFDPTDTYYGEISIIQP